MKHWQNLSSRGSNSQHEAFREGEAPAEPHLTKTLALVLNHRLRADIAPRRFVLLLNMVQCRIRANSQSATGGLFASAVTGRVFHPHRRQARCALLDKPAVAPEICTSGKLISRGRIQPYHNSGRT